MSSVRPAPPTTTTKQLVSGVLAQRLAPLLTALGFTISVSAPLAYFAVETRALEEAGRRTAEQASLVFAREAEAAPLLWRYDSLKLQDHLRRFELQSNVARIEVVDEDGAPIDPAYEPPAASLLWAVAPIRVQGARIGDVWIGMDRTNVRQTAEALLGVFTLLAIALCVSVYRIVMRSARGAEQQIGSLVEQLAQRSVEERVRALRLRAIAEQEEDRRAIARDLHDAVGQSLTAIRIQAQVLAAQIDRPDERARDGVRKSAKAIADTTDMTLEEVRRALGRLRPAALDEIGLADAISRLADDLAERRELQVDIDAHDLGAMPTTVETAAYRIVQEALTNVMRHAPRASHVRVHLVREGSAAGDSLLLTVDDDGGDARSVDASSGGGRGVRGMRERAELLGGEFRWSRTPKGVQLEARLPIHLETA